MAGLELTGSALTALFVALVYTLMKVVEFFLKKKPDLTKKDALVVEHDELAALSENISEMHKLHMVFDQNHMPLWYVPRELITLVNEMDTNIKDLKNCLNEIKTDQSIYIDKFSELITSQMLLAQRIGDLIAKLDRNIS